MSNEILELAKRYSAPVISSDPVLWAKNVVHTETYSKQREILRAVEMEIPKIAVPSCHSAGKSKTAALVAVRWLSRWPPGTARVVTTAPTMTQVRAILWNEINALHSKAVDEKGALLLPGRVNQTEWWIGGYMAGIGRKPADYAPETFSGLHAEHLLVIIDEAGGVPNEIWTGVSTLATNEGSVILAIGNPDDPQSKFKDIVTNARTPEGNGWMVIQIPAWETPNLSGEPCADIFKKVLITKSWVEDARRDWGEDSGLWAAKIAAEFPDEDSMTIIRVADVSNALDGAPDYDAEEAARYSRGAHIQLGVDIAASETGDHTIIRERVGRKILRRWSIQTEDPEAISDLIVEAQTQSGATMIHLDATGVGFGFVGDLRRRMPEVAIMPFIAAAMADDKTQFVNRRAEAHWYTREMLRKNLLDLSSMEESTDTKKKSGTVKQLTSVRYKIVKGRIQVELKDDVRKRIGSSPDDADALHLAVLPPSGAGGPVRATVRATRRGSVKPSKPLIPLVGNTVAGHTLAVPQRHIRRSRTLRAR